MQISLYDTAGMERFEGTIPPTYFRSAKVVMFVYSVTDVDSINDLNSWADSISPQRLGDDVESMLRVLVGNKIDIEESEREVHRERGTEVAENLSVDKDLFFEISALEGTGFDCMFETIVRRLQNSRQGATCQSATLSLTSQEKGGRGNSDCAC